MFKQTGLQIYPECSCPDREYVDTVGKGSIGIHTHLGRGNKYDICNSSSLCDDVLTHLVIFCVKSIHFSSSSIFCKDLGVGSNIQLVMKALYLRNQSKYKCLLALNSKRLSLFSSFDQTYLSA